MSRCSPYWPNALDYKSKGGVNVVEQKLRELRERLQTGEQQLLFLDQKRAELRDTLLRISGAIEVLEEVAASNGHKEASAVEDTVSVS